MKWRNVKKGIGLHSPDFLLLQWLMFHYSYAAAFSLDGQ